MALKTGDIAPTFKLISSELKEVSLEDFKGRNLIIHFFPLAFTSVCTSQLCTMRDNFGHYLDIGTDIVAISVDAPFSLARFKSENNYPFFLLSDFNKEIAPAYGAFYDTFVYGLRGVAKRAGFVIGPDQRIKYAEVLESAGDLPDFDAMYAAAKD